MIQKFGIIFNNPTIASVTGASTPFFINLAAKVFKISSDEQELLTYIRKINTLNDQRYTKPVLDNLVKEIHELSEGRYKIDGLDNVIDDDIKTMKFLESGEQLRTMTPLPGSKTAIDEYIKRKNHQNVVKEIKQCGDRGVLVRKVYVLDEFDHITSSLISEIENLESSKVSVRLVKLEKFDEKNCKHIDIVVFSNRKASIGSTSLKNGTCKAANIYTNDKEKIDKWIGEYESIFQWGIPIQEISN